MTSTRTPRRVKYAARSKMKLPNRSPAKRGNPVVSMQTLSAEGRSADIATTYSLSCMS